MADKHRVRAAHRLSSRSTIQACETLLGTQVRGIERPGGTSRKSVRALIGDGSVFVTRRKNPERARLEASVLEALHAGGAPVPRVLAFDGVFLVQEDLGGQRLSEALAGVDATQGEKWLDAALDSLAKIHRAAAAAGLEARGVRLGENHEWIEQLITMPARLARHFDLPAPSLREETLFALLGLHERRLIKWDARPGNAIAREDGSVAWFDWEHCGVRNRLDDVAWLLGDEYVADWPEVEAVLLRRHLDAFAGAIGRDVATTYLAAFGTLHMCVRLGLILDRKGAGPWWEASYCVAGDKIGVNLDAAQNLCHRAARWADRCPAMDTLPSWFEELSRQLGDL